MVVDTLHLAHLRDNRTRTARYLGEGIDRWDQAALADDDADEDLAAGHGVKDLAAHHLGPDADAARRRLWAARRLPDGRSATFTRPGR
jgi:hypothetical protein